MVGTMISKEGSNEEGEFSFKPGEKSPMLSSKNRY
jgi:hypothetical protein